jgi:hypothetical protein
VDPDQFQLLADGWYPFKIFEAEEMKSSKGNDMVLAKCEVSGHSEEADGQTVWHYVTFLPKDRKGAGISVHFRKCIGVPYGGEDEVDARDWIGKRFIGKVTTEEFEGKRRNKIAEISPIESGKTTDAQIPF